MTLFDPGTEPGENSSADGMIRIVMLVAYDGTGLHGFSAQAGVRTVAGLMQAALERAVGRPVRLSCAGRTDSGVHARGQMVQLDLPHALADPLRLERAVNRQLAPKVVVLASSEVDPGFHVRHSAIARRYSYSIRAASVPDPLTARTTWWVRSPLDVRAMRAATDALLGERDFSAFCRRPPGKTGELRRRVTDISLAAGDGSLRLSITANAFCHQMVRSVVGTLVDVGRGRIRAADVTSIVSSGDRARASQLAPARGLCLEQVYYDRPVFVGSPVAPAQLSCLCER